MTDEDVVALLQGDGEAQRRGLRILYNGKGAEFGRFFMRCGLSHADAQDAVQDTVLKILRAASQYTNEKSAKAWMWSIARNTMIDFKRRQKRNLEDTLDDNDWNNKFEVVGQTEASVGLDGSDTTASASEVELCVSRGIKRFADEEPERAYAISLHVDGIDGREIAERIGRSYEATRQYLLQCRQKLAPFISNCIQLLKV
jgi:RNA polymerase sigma factor (sigma-70 family)